MRTPLVQGLLLLSLALSAACGSAAESGAESRYPEKRRPPPLRSASDGEIMGANRQAPEDTLEALPTNQHPAPGWVMEDGVLVPEREARRRAAATKAATADCDPNPPDPKSSPGATPAASTSAANPPAAGTAPASANLMKPRCPKPAAR